MCGAGQQEGPGLLCWVCSEGLNHGWNSLFIVLCFPHITNSLRVILKHNLLISIPSLEHPEAKDLNLKMRNYHMQATLA